MGSRHSFMTGTWKDSQAGSRTSARSDAADRPRNIMLSGASPQFRLDM